MINKFWDKTSFVFIIIVFLQKFIYKLYLKNYEKSIISLFIVHLWNG